MPKSRETVCRTFVKTLGWRAIATTVTVVSTYIISGSFDAAWQVGSVDIVFKLGGHLIYEKAWAHCKWGYLIGGDGEGDEGEGEEAEGEEAEAKGEAEGEGDIEMAGSTVAVENASVDGAIGEELGA